MTQVKITQDVVEEIKARLDIVDIVGERVVLRKTGSNYKGLCPFHNEKTPSFTVNQDKQIFYCFGCSTGGDLISFVEKTESLSFYETIKKLAAIAGVKLPTKEVSPRQKELIDKRQRLMNINILARDYYSHNMKIPGNSGIEYASNRGLSEQTIRDFSLGYATETWDDLSIMLSKKAVQLSDAVLLGIIKEKNGRYYDTFRDRLIFPILDHRGGTVAFGARILEAKDDSPKYINSKESELYKKGEVLYGLNITGKEIREKSYAVVVEGYMDLLSLYQAGIKNVVATLGTSFTDRQVFLIKRYTERVVLFYDSDDAGIAAAKRSFESLTKNGIKVDALFLEDGTDPDDAVQKLGYEKLSGMLKNAKPLMERLISDRFSGNIGVDEMSDITRDILGFIAMIPDPVSRAMWLKELSLRTGLEVKELNRLLLNAQKAIEKERPESSRVADHRLFEDYKKIDPLKRKLLLTIFFYPELSIRLCEDEWEPYVPEDIRLMATKASSILEQRNQVGISDWLYIAKDSGVDWFEAMLSKEIINRKDNEGMNFEKEFEGCLVRFKMRYLEKNRQESLRKIKEGESSETCLREYKAIVQEINKLKPTLGALE